MGGFRHLTGRPVPRIAQEHQDYVFGPNQTDEAASRLAEISPTVVTSDRPLLRIGERDPHARLSVKPFQHPDTGRYMNILEGTRIELAPELIAALSKKVDANSRSFPREDTLASSFGVPGLYVRMDCFLAAAGAGPNRVNSDPDATWSDQQWRRAEIAVCEFDDQPAFVGSFRLAGHTSAYRMFARLADELDQLGRPLRLAEHDEDPAFYTLDNYPHDERHWLQDMGQQADPGQVAAIVRARRWVSGSRRFLERWNRASIFPGSEFRDYKGVLGLPRTFDAELGLGVMVRDHDVARGVVALAHGDGLPAVVAKALFSARKEGVMAIRAGSKVPASYYRLNQLKRLSHGIEDGTPYLQPIVLQPAFQPPTLKNLGIQLTDHDAEVVRCHHYRGRTGEARTGASVFAHLPAPGNERRFYGLFRLYFVYLPSENRGASKILRFAGGLLQACTTPMAIHGTNGALTVWVQGVEPETPMNFDGSIGSRAGRPGVDLMRLPRFVPPPKPQQWSSLTARRDGA